MKENNSDGSMEKTDYFIFASLALSFAGSYLVALLLFKKRLAAGVTNLKLFGFLLSFLVSFFGIMYALSQIIVRQVPFER